MHPVHIYLIHLDVIRGVYPEGEIITGSSRFVAVIDMDRGYNIRYVFQGTDPQIIYVMVRARHPYLEIGSAKILVQERSEQVVSIDIPISVAIAVPGIINALCIYMPVLPAAGRPVPEIHLPGRCGCGTRERPPYEHTPGTPGVRFAEERKLVLQAIRKIHGHF